jgi:DNA-binding transcriptional ArsR family regulator
MESAMIRAVASAHRCAILKLIWDRELAAGEIAAHFTISWPAVSQNLRVLRRAGAVTERREGTRRLYRADRQALGPLADVVRSMWAADFETLRNLVEGDLETPPS